jgi:hypothetical protein
MKMWHPPPPKYFSVKATTDKTVTGVINVVCDMTDTCTDRKICNSLRFRATCPILRFPHLIILKKKKSRDSSVGIALGYGLDDRGSRVRFPAGAGNFSLASRTAPGPTQPPIQ